MKIQRCFLFSNILFWGVLLTFVRAGDECNRNGKGCSSNRWCDTDALKCYRKREIGDSCNRDEKCLSDCCEKGKCVRERGSSSSGGGGGGGGDHDYYPVEEDECYRDSDCPRYYYCNQNHECAKESKKRLGQHCKRDYDCESGSCDNDECGWLFFDWHCGSDTCVPVNGRLGEYCTQDYQVRGPSKYIIEPSICGLLLVKEERSWLIFVGSPEFQSASRTVANTTVVIIIVGTPTVMDGSETFVFFAA